MTKSLRRPVFRELRRAITYAEGFMDLVEELSFGDNSAQFADLTSWPADDFVNTDMTLRIGIYSLTKPISTMLEYPTLTTEVAYRGDGGKRHLYTMQFSKEDPFGYTALEFEYDPEDPFNLRKCFSIDRSGYIQRDIPPQTFKDCAVRVRRARRYGKLVAQAVPIYPAPN